MKKTLLLLIVIAIYSNLNSQVPFAEFDFNGNINCSNSSVYIEGEPKYNADNTALLFQKDYYLNIFDKEVFSDMNYTIELRFKRNSEFADENTNKNIEGLMMKGFGTGSGERQFSVSLHSAYIPFHFIYAAGLYNDIQNVAIEDVVTPKEWYHIFIVQTLDSAYVYNESELLSKNEINAEFMKFMPDMPTFLGKLLVPSGNPYDRYFDGEIDFLKYYDEALTYRQINSMFEDEDLHSANELTLKMNFGPNPNSGTLFIFSENISNVKIVDLFGKTVYSENEIKEKDFSIDISYLSAGSYYLIGSDEYSNQKSQMLIMGR